MAPNGARGIFLLIQTLPTFWATWILILRISFDFLVPKNQDFQVPSGFTNFQKSGLSLASGQRLPWTGQNLGQKWVGPRGAQVGGPKPEIWDPKKMKQIKNLKIKIRSAQNVGKVTS